MLGKLTFNGIVIRVTGIKPVDKKTKSGIIIPDTVDEETIKKMKMDLFYEYPFQGIVIQVSEAIKKQENPICKEGDCVYLKDETSVSPFIEDGVYYSYVREHDIIYVIDKEIYEEYKLKKQTNEIAN